MKYLLVILLSTIGLGCGSSDDANNANNANNGNNGNNQNNTSAKVDRAGPESLAGFTWASEPMEINGVTLQLEFEFTETEVIAATVCNGSTRVETSAPIRYTYEVKIPDGGTNEVEEGGDTCFVSVDAGTFDVEIVDGALEMTTMDQTVSFQSANGNSGIYGDWTASLDGYSLTWRMGKGEISTTGTCDNGLSVDLDVPASFRNFVTIEEDATGGDESCSVAVAASELEYLFRGDDLVMIFEGEELVFRK